MRRVVQLHHTLRQSIAIAVALCVLVAGWMAASPQAHQDLHHDAEDADHECLITMMASGAIDHLITTAVIVFCAVQVVQRLSNLHSEWVLPLFLNGSVLEHGPPAVC